MQWFWLHFWIAHRIIFGTGSNESQIKSEINK